MLLCAQGTQVGWECACSCTGAAGAQGADWVWALLLQAMGQPCDYAFVLRHRGTYGLVDLQARQGLASPWARLGSSKPAQTEDGRKLLATAQPIRAIASVFKIACLAQI